MVEKECVMCKEQFTTEYAWVEHCGECKVKYDQEQEKERNRVESIFTVENMEKHCKTYLSDPDDPYLCRFVRGFEGEEMEFIYKSGDEIVIDRIHIDELWEITWDDSPVINEMIFRLSDVIDMLDFFKEV